MSTIKEKEELKVDNKIIENNEEHTTEDINIAVDNIDSVYDENKENTENKSNKKINKFILIILMFIALIICYFLFVYTKLTGIVISNNKEYLFIGETQQLSYDLIFNKEEVSEKIYSKFKENTSVEWFVGNDCATISEDGLLSAVSKGTVVVGIRSGEFSHSVEIEVRVPVEDIVVENVLLSLINYKQEMSYTVYPADAYVEEITVLVEDKNIATHNMLDNHFYAHQTGETTAKIICGNIEKEISIKVMKAVESISVNNLNVIVGAGGQLNVKAQPDDAEIGLDFKYTSNNEKVAKVNENGWVSAVGSGTTTITIENEFGVSCESTVKVQGYPLSYSDATSNITIYREWYGNAWVYAAHITFTDYNRFGTACGRNVYGGTETTSSAAARQGAILCINGCYSAPYLNYATARSGVVMNDGKCYSPGVYSKHNGLLLSAWEVGGVSGYTGVQLSSLVASGAVTDTFTFGPPFLINGAIKGSNTGSRAQRTFIGTNGNPGDIWLCVSDGRYNDGASAGLTGYECAAYLQSKGCTLGVPLDGGGSSTMVFRGTVLNAARGNQRSVVDFAYFR